MKTLTALMTAATLLGALPALAADQSTAAAPSTSTQQETGWRWHHRWHRWHRGWGAPGCHIGFFHVGCHADVNADEAAE